MQSSSWVDSVDNIRKQRDDLLVRVSNLEINVDRLMKENATLGERNIHLQTLADSGTISYQNLAAMHKDATETFARTIASMASGQGSSKKRSRSDSQNEEEEEAETKRREEGIDRYANGLLALRDAAHAKKIEELKEVHKREISKLRARVDEPVNEFRVSKQFHIKEAALRGEIQSLQGQLESEKTKSKSMEFAQVERMDEMRTSKELKQRTIERDRLAVEVQGMKAEMERMREPYRSMGNQELLGIIDVLKVHVGEFLESNG